MSWWLVTFSRRGPARYASHLDTARALQRTFARAGVTLARSGGMRPKPRLSLPLPLPVGAAARAELAVVEVADEAGSIDLGAALRALRAAGGGGLAVEALGVAAQRPRPVAREAAYACRLAGPVAAIVAAARDLAAAREWPIERISPKGRKAVDVKRYLSDVTATECDDGACLTFTLRIEPGGTARPSEVAAAVAAGAGVEAVPLGLERLGVRFEGVDSWRGEPGKT